MKTFVCAVCLLLAACCTLSTHAQTRYSQRMAESQGKQWTHGKSWDYVNGLVAKSLLNLCEHRQHQFGQGALRPLPPRKSLGRAERHAQCRPLQKGCRLASELPGERLFAYPDRRCQRMFLP